MKKRKNRISYQGEKGAYSEIALYNFFGKEVEVFGFELSEQVCEALRDGEVDYGILPVENSIVGNVDINLDLLLHHNITAIGEIYLKIQHCLLGIKGTKLKDIKRAKSHPIALAQCRDFLNRHNIKPIADFDTAGACAILARDRIIDEATIASSLCSKYYDLEIIEEHIQKVKNNFTRFLIFTKPKDRDVKIKEEKTSIAFSAKHTPGALLSCLQVFASHNLNLTKLQSRPIPENPFVYTFYVDFLGGHHSIEVRDCLAELKDHTTSLKVIGSYPLATKPTRD